MIENILLDIDGVCNTFQHHVFDCLGLPYPDDSWYPVDCGWDIVAAANRLAGHERFTSDELSGTPLHARRVGPRSALA